MASLSNLGNLVSRSKKQQVTAQLPKEAILIDVRSPAEYQSGHLGDAISLPLNQIEHRISEFVSDKSALIIVYCQSGLRALTAYKYLRELGYSNVENGGAMESLSGRMTLK